VLLEEAKVVLVLCAWCLVLGAWCLVLHAVCDPDLVPHPTAMELAQSQIVNN
jgi:hypothetical protein